MTQSYPTASTPLPSVHVANVPVPKTISPEVFEALVLNLFGALAIALAGVSIFGVHPLEFLKSWGEALESQAATALANANGNTDGVVQATSGSSSTGNATTGVANFLTPEITLLHNLASGVGTVYEDLSGLISGLSGRMTAIENTVAGGTPAGGYDNCSTVTRFTNVVGTLASNGYSILSTATAIGYHTDGPATIKHGIKFQLDRKQQGVCRGTICGDTAFANYLAIELGTGGFGNDYVRLGVGSGPNVVMELAQTDGTPVQWSGNIDPNWVWEVYYSDNPITNTFYVTRNGVPVTELQYTDSTNLVTHTTGTDIHVGWESNCNNNTVFKGCALTGFTYYDLAN